MSKFYELFLVLSINAVIILSCSVAQMVSIYKRTIKSKQVINKPGMKLKDFLEICDPDIIVSISIQYQPILFTNTAKFIRNLKETGENEILNDDVYDREIERFTLAPVQFIDCAILPEEPKDIGLIYRKCIGPTAKNDIVVGNHQTLTNIELKRNKPKYYLSCYKGYKEIDPVNDTMIILMLK